MTKLKTARTLMAIILISVGGWVAVVALVIKPPLWLGAILSIIGGIAIGTVVAYLIRRWWLGRRAEWPNPTATARKPGFKLGTNFSSEDGTHRYARAGEDLKRGTIVEADLAGRIFPPPGPNMLKVTSELIWGNVKAAREVGPEGINVLGWPEVNVKRGRYCWLKQPPPGSEFKKEEG